MANTYTVIAEQTESGAWSAYVPDLPTILVVGETYEALTQNARTAIELYIEEMHAAGESVPSPSARALTVQVAA